MFLKISQNSQESTCARVCFNKVKGLGPAIKFNYEKKLESYVSFLYIPKYLSGLILVRAYPKIQKLFKVTKQYMLAY